MKKTASGSHGPPKPCRIAILLMLTVCVGPWRGTARAQDGGIDIFIGETLFSKGLLVTEGYLYQRKTDMYRGSDKVANPNHRSFEENRFVTGLSYGVHPSVTLSALLPFVHRDAEKDTPGGRDDIESAGLGDVSFLAKWRPYHKEWGRNTLSYSLIAGLETPTGRDDETYSGALLSPGLQLGSGSWDPFVAGASTLNFNRLKIGLSALYKVNTEGTQRFDQGDVVSVDFNLGYRFLLMKYPGPVASAKAGIVFRDEGVGRSSGSRLDNSGSQQFLFRTGITGHPTPNTDVIFLVDLPFHQEFRGSQLGLDFKTFIAFGIRW